MFSNQVSSYKNTTSHLLSTTQIHISSSFIFSLLINIIHLVQAKYIDYVYESAQT